MTSLENGYADSFSLIILWKGWS